MTACPAGRAQRAGAVALVCMALLTVSCGFQLRGSQSVRLPPDLKVMRIVMGAGYPPLLVEVRNSLRVLGQVRVTDDIKATVPVLNILREQSVSEVLSVDSTGRINAYLLNYRIDFSLTGADGKNLLPAQSIKLQREYTFDRLNVLATERQAEFLQNEMRRDAAQQILRRLASLNQLRKTATDADQP